MISTACQHESAKKHGRDKFGRQRYKCLVCGATFTDEKAKILGSSRLPKERAVTCLKLLLEGMSIRATSRLTGTDKNSIIGLVTTLGPRCEAFLKATIRGIPVQEVQCDEMWGFVGAKQKTCDRYGYGPEFGDAYCYVAMERNTKLVLTYHIDKRSSEGTLEFIDNLYFATSGRFQVSTDGYGPYRNIIPQILDKVDYCQVIKSFGEDRDGQQRYSPAKIVSMEIVYACGSPDLDRASTSHSERLNLSLRMQIRRLTRLTNAHSKKWENHKAMLSLYFAWYNFCRVHSTIKTTPAVAQGLTDHEWTIEKLLRKIATF